MQPASLLFQATTTHESESAPTKGEGRCESCEAKGLVGLPNDTSPSVPTEVAQAASRGRLKLRVLLSCHVEAEPALPGGVRLSTLESDRLGLVDAFPQDLLMSPWPQLDTFNHAVGRVMPQPRVRRSHFRGAEPAGFEGALFLCVGAGPSLK